MKPRITSQDKRSPLLALRSLTTKADCFSLAAREQLQDICTANEQQEVDIAVGLPPLPPPLEDPPDIVDQMGALCSATLSWLLQIAEQNDIAEPIRMAALTSALIFPKLVATPPKRTHAKPYEKVRWVRQQLLFFASGQWGRALDQVELARKQRTIPSDPILGRTLLQSQAISLARAAKLQRLRPAWRKLASHGLLPRG